MKHPWLVPAVAVLLALQACKKKECCDIPVAPDFMLAKQNEASWQAVPSGSILQGDTIMISGRYNAGNTTEELTFKIRFDGLGYYPLKANENYYHITEPGAAVTVYQPDPTHVNNVTILSYNKAGKIVQGYFELRFVKITKGANNLLPDKLIINQGKFKVTLNQ